MGKPLCCVIAEYNPFHLGHAHHLAQTRRALGDCTLAVVMSGHFVQRGEPAILDKWTRASLALQGGADLVFELPAAYALQSAEQFARGAVAAACAMGAAFLSFGSEQPLPTLEQIARNYRREDAGLRAAMQKGSTYARAMGEFLCAQGADVAHAPNAVLGAMYLRWLEELIPDTRPIIIPRDASMASASAVRAALSGGEDWHPHVPPYTALALADGSMVDEAFFDRLMLHVLREHGVDDPLLHARMAKCARTVTSYAALLEAVKTKNVTMARVKRACMRALASITQADLEAANHAPAPYLRVLAWKREAQDVLGQIEAQAGAPLILSPAKARLEGLAARLFALDCTATDAWMLLHRDGVMRCAGQDFTRRITPLED